VLRESTGLPILGSVSMTRNPDRNKRERRTKWLFLGGVGSLVGLFASLTVVIVLLGR